MNEDNINMEIRKFLKKVGITSQRIIENQINMANESGAIRIGDKIELEMSLTIKNFNTMNSISGTILID